MNDWTRLFCVCSLYPTRSDSSDESASESGELIDSSKPPTLMMLNMFPDVPVARTVSLTVTGSDPTVL